MPSILPTVRKNCHALIRRVRAGAAGNCGKAPGPSPESGVSATSRGKQSRVRVRMDNLNCEEPEYSGIGKFRTVAGIPSDE